MEPVKNLKKRGRKPITSTLLSGDRQIDEIKMRAILLLNNKSPRIAANELGISESAVAKFLKLKARSSRFFRYLESLAKNNDIIVKRSY
jgi:hypothetical protein